MSKQKQKTIFVQNMFSPCSELVVFMYLTVQSMTNPLSYCGLVDVRINASDKDLPVKMRKMVKLKNIILLKKVMKTKNLQLHTITHITYAKP